MDQAYFKEYYHLERENWWFKVRRKILSERIFSVLKNPKNISSLNVGAATGTTSDMLSAFGDVISVEYDESCCQFTQSFLATPMIHGSILELPFNNETFDLVCAFDVIEHVADDQKAISEMYRVCKPGGFIAVTVPAYQFLWGQHDTINQHFRRYTLSQLVKLFGNYQGQISYKTYFNSVLFVPIAAFRLITKLFSRKKQSLAASDHEILGTNGIFNPLLTLFFSIDYVFLKWGIRFPAGVSIMVFFKKLNYENE